MNTEGLPLSHSGAVEPLGAGVSPLWEEQWGDVVIETLGLGRVTRGNDESFRHRHCDRTRCNGQYSPFSGRNRSVGLLT